MPTWNHLWFVAYLWVYTVVLFGLVKLLPVVPRIRALAERHLAGLGVVFWPIAYLALARFTLAARFPQTHALVDDWYNHANFFGVFILGFILAGTRAPWRALERMRWHTLGFAVLGWALFSSYVSLYDDNAPPSMALIGSMRVVYGAEQWLAIAALLGFARRHLNADSPARRYLTTAIFPVYILHQTVIVVVAHSLKPAHLYAPIEALLLVLVTAATCLLGYELIRRVAPLRPLFGVPSEKRAHRALAEERLPVAPRLTEPCMHPQDIN
jgi:hypothetical protein